MEPTEKICENLNASMLVLTVFAVIIVELYFLSPGIILYNAFHSQKNVNLKNLPVLQIFFNLINCSQYIILGVNGEDITSRDSGDLQKQICNGIGITISLINAIFLYSFFAKRNLTDILVYYFLGFNVIFEISYFIYKISNSKYNLTFYTAIIFNILMYLSTWQNLIWAISLKDPSLIPIFSCIFGLASSILWSVYGNYCKEWIYYIK